MNRCPLFQKAFLYKSLGQLTEARAALEQLVQSYPDHQLAAEARRQLSLMETK